MNGSLENRLQQLGVTVRADEYEDVILWSNWHAVKDWGLYIVLTVFSVVVTAVAVGFTFAAVQGNDATGFVIAAAISWVMQLVLLIPFARLGANEEIHIANREVELRFCGLFSNSIKRLSREQVVALSLEWHGDDTAQTLNLWCEVGLLYSNRILMGYTLSHAARGMVYSWLKQSFASHGWEIDFRCDVRSRPHVLNQRS